METDIVTVDPAMSLLQVHRLFVEEEINGAPVVGDDGRVRGIISSLDLLRAVEEEYLGRSGATVPFYHREDMPYSGPDWLSAPEDFQDRMNEMTASDAMVTEIVSVAPGTPVAEVAHIMRDQHIHRVLVIEDNQLRGILSTFDLIRVLETTSQGAAAP